VPGFQNRGNRTFENEIGERLSSQLRNVLGEYIGEGEGVSRMIGEDPTIEARVELISHFAMTGSLPLWADPSNVQLVDESVAALQSQANGSSRLREVIVKDIATLPGALERLVRHLDVSRLRILLEDIIETSRPMAKERAALVWEIIAMARTTWTGVPRATIWAEALRVSAVGESRNEGAVAFSRELIARVALAGGTTYLCLVDELWAKLKPAKGPKAGMGLAAVVLALRQEMGITEAKTPPVDLVNSTTYSVITSRKAGDASATAALTFRKDGDAFAAAVITFLNDGDAFAGIHGVPSTVRNAFANAADAPSTVRNAFANAADTPSTVQDAFADAADAPSTVQDAFANAADAPSKVQDAFTDAADSPSTVQDAFANAADAPPTVRDALTDDAEGPPTVRKAFPSVAPQSSEDRSSSAESSQRRSMVPAMSLHTNKTMPSLPAARRTTARHEDPDEIYLTTAGLILLWPFVATLFDRVGLLAPPDPQKTPCFFDHASRCRGVMLLHYLATAQDVPPEYRLPLEKILCGLHLQEPFYPGKEFTEFEVSEAESLLSAVITHAPNLGDITVQGFRTAFLCRRGVLSMRDGTWLLRVEKDAFDAVLRGLPWAVSWIRLPFMEASLAVEWVV
jgi:hypothetical protein